MIRTLGDALTAPDQMPWNEWLLLRRESWTAGSPCRVENFDDLPDDVDLPADAVREDFTVALDGQSVQSVVSNLLQHVPEADLALRLEAFEYYMDNDAFIDVSQRG
jgi:hypothetical protein